MEDVSKALLMAAGILLAILVMAVAARFFSSASDLMESFQTQERVSNATQFNSRFTKYIGSRNTDSSIRGYATIHDIVSLANFAWNYNNEQVYELKKMTLSEQLEDHRIIHINITNGLATKNQNNVEITNAGSSIISDLQNYNQVAYNFLLDKIYFRNNDFPNTKSIINFKIDIKGTNAEGKIYNVDFYPASVDEISNSKESINTLNINIKETCKEITDEKNKDKYRKYDFK